MNSNNMEKESSIENMIKEGKRCEIGVHTSTLYYLSDENCLVPIENLFRRHIAYIKEKCVTVTLSDEEADVYKYNPYKLSYDIYNTTELWFIICMINDVIHPASFTKNKLLLLKKTDLRVINDIFMIDDIRIKNNKKNGYK